MITDSASSTNNRILVLTGVNLGRLGTREPEVYGKDSYPDLVALCQQTGVELGVEVDARQTDSEAEMVSWLHLAADENLRVVINPGAWAHYSIAIRDACAMLTAPFVEVHITNVHAREAFRQNLVISPLANGVICGLGIEGYALALRWLTRK